MSASLRHHNSGQAHDDAAGQQFTLLLGRHRTFAGPRTTPVRARPSARRRHPGRPAGNARARTQRLPGAGHVVRPHRRRRAAVPHRRRPAARTAAQSRAALAVRLRDPAAPVPPAVEVRRDPETGRVAWVGKRRPMRTTVPNAWAFPRSMANVVCLERRAGMVSDLVPRLRRELMQALPDYGRFLGADGKAIPSHSTGRTLKGKGRTSDPDADRGVHAHKGVNQRTGKPWERIASWFGYKLHLIGDTQHELPVAFSVEKASVSERKVLSRDLVVLFEAEKPLAGRCRELSADRGYDQAELKRWLWDAHRIRPPIDIRLLWRGDWDALPKRPGEPTLRPLDPTRVDNVLHSEQGRVFRRCPATGTMRPMAFHDLDSKRNALKCLAPPPLTTLSAKAGRNAAPTPARIPASWARRGAYIWTRPTGASSRPLRTVPAPGARATPGAAPWSASTPDSTGASASRATPSPARPGLPPGSNSRWQ